MPNSSPDALSLSRKALRLLVKLNLVMGALILALLVATFVAETPVMEALGVRPAASHPALIVGMRLVALIGIASVPVVHLILARLLAIVESVRVGDPLTLTNAARLRAIARAVLALEGAHFVAGAIALGVSTPSMPLNIGLGFSLTRWLAALMLFVLARVFEQGASMRDELAATI